MTRHQRWVFTLVAAIGTAVMLPMEPHRLLILGVPTMWVLSYLAYRHDRLETAVAGAETRITTRIETTEKALADHIDIGVADITIAVHNSHRNQRAANYDRSGGGLRSV